MNVLALAEEARISRSVDLASVLARAEATSISRNIELASVLARAEATSISRSVDLASVLARAEATSISRNVELASVLARAEATSISRSVDLASVRVAEVARMVEPFRAVIASVSAWEASLTARIAELRKPWALLDHSDQSMMGFARLSRLSDAVHTAAPYSESVGELVANELGGGVEADPVRRYSKRTR